MSLCLCLQLSTSLGLILEWCTTCFCLDAMAGFSKALGKGGHSKLCVVHVFMYVCVCVWMFVCMCDVIEDRKYEI